MKKVYRLTLDEVQKIVVDEVARREGISTGIGRMFVETGWLGGLKSAVVEITPKTPETRKG